MVDGGSIGAAFSETSDADVFERAGARGAGGSTIVIGTAPMKFSGVRGIGSGPTARSSATTIQATTSVCTTTEQILKNRGIASSCDRVGQADELSGWTPHRACGSLEPREPTCSSARRRQRSTSTYCRLG